MDLRIERGDDGGFEMITVTWEVVEVVVVVCCFVWCHHPVGSCGSQSRNIARSWERTRLHRHRPVGQSWM